jgi:hypothetical protein
MTPPSSAAATPAPGGPVLRRLLQAEDPQHTALTLRDSGALVVRAPARGFGAAAVNTYLHVKARGLL